MTVEIMGSKISNKYGFKDDKHFINPHGSIIYPKNQIPKFSYESLREWFTKDSENRWANVEGIVIHFPEIGTRLKFHRGHVDMQSTWDTKKESGVKFVWN